MSRCEYDRERRMTIPFTREQERDLKSHKGKEMTVHQLQLYFNEKYGANKSYECIRAYCAENRITLDAKRIKRPRFTDCEINYINNNSHLNTQQLAANLSSIFGHNRSFAGVQRVIKRLGLKKPTPKYHSFTDDHCAYLLGYSGSAKNLNSDFNARFDCDLTYEQIYQKRRNLLKKLAKKSTLTKETRL